MFFKETKQNKLSRLKNLSVLLLHVFTNYPKLLDGFFNPLRPIRPKTKTHQTQNSWRTLHLWWRLKSPSMSVCQPIPCQWIPNQWIRRPWKNLIPNRTNQSQCVPLGILNLKGLLWGNLVQWLWVSAQHLGARAQLRPNRHRCLHHRCLAKKPCKRRRR